MMTYLIRKCSNFRRSCNSISHHSFFPQIRDVPRGILFNCIQQNEYAGFRKQSQESKYDVQIVIRRKDLKSLSFNQNYMVPFQEEISIGL